MADLVNTATISERYDVANLMKEEISNKSETRKHVMMKKVGVRLLYMLHKIEMKKVSKDSFQLFERTFGFSLSKNKESNQATKATEKRKMM